MHCVDFHDLGPKTPVRENQDGTTFLVASVEQLFVNTPSKDKGTSQRKQPQSTSKARQDDTEATLFEELGNPANYGLCQSGSGTNGKNLSATMYAEQTMKENLSISVFDPVKVSVNDKQNTSVSNVIWLSDDDEQEANVAGTLSGRKVVENPENSFWHCVAPSGEKRGPFSMAAIKRWSETFPHPVEIKVWKTGQSEREAIPLTDALNRFFSSV